MRRAHWLGKLRNAELPRHLFFVDTETNPVELNERQTAEQLYFGYAAYTRRRLLLNFDTAQWMRFENSLEFWEWVTDKIPLKEKAYLFAHNLGFDLPVLNFLENLNSLGWTLTNFILDDPPTMINFEWCPNHCGKPSGAGFRKASKCVMPHRKLVMLDTFNYFAMSLEALGDAIGTEKIEVPRSPEGRPDWDGMSEAQQEHYGKQDVQVLIDAIHNYLKFITDHKLGSFQITQASQSFTAYRHRFMVNPIFIDDNQDALQMGRASYFGGRVEAFRLGEYTGDFYKLDINSMYPSVMMSDWFPSELRTTWTNVDLEEYASDVRGKFATVADVTIKTDRPVYPYLEKQGSKLLFPTGEFRLHMAGPELEYAIDNGHVAKMHRLALYTPAPLFRDFIDYFYQMRLQARLDGDEAQSFFLKIMMNSLYGKFGQNGRKWDLLEWNGVEQIKVWAEVNGDTGEIHHFRQVGNILQSLAGMAEAQHSHPAIAATITSAARLRLWTLIDRAGIDNVWYCDTDSIITNARGYEILTDELHDSELGRLKLEQQADYVAIYGVKDYQIGEDVKLKGVRANAEKVADNTYRHDTFRGFKGMLRDGDFSRVIITKGLKHLRRVYDKGQVMPNGRVIPWVLPR